MPTQGANEALSLQASSILLPTAIKTSETAARKKFSGARVPTQAPTATPGTEPSNNYPSNSRSTLPINR